MIRCNEGEVMIRGNGHMLAAEFCTIALALLEDGVMTEKGLDKLMDIIKEDFNKKQKEDVFEIEIDGEELKKQMKGENND